MGHRSVPNKRLRYNPCNVRSDKSGRLHKGGLNFDAKVRRASYKVEDLFIGHIAGMDTFALGFKVAYKLVKDGVLDKFIEEKYRSFREGIGRDIVEGKVDFEKLEEYIIDKETIELPSGKQEYLESLINSYIVKTILELR